jgi:hypothetical protein
MKTGKKVYFNIREAFKYSLPLKIVLRSFLNNIRKKDLISRVEEAVQSGVLLNY